MDNSKSNASIEDETSNSPRGRGRSRNRAGVGKYLRARGIRGRGRAAVFGRLRLEEEEEVELDEEAAQELQMKYSRRQLGSNADRYEEPEADPEEEPEPEVDLSSFFEKQRISETSSPPEPSMEPDEDDDVDHSLAHISTRPQDKQIESSTRKSKKGVIEWDESLDEMKREKESAEAVWDLKTRFKSAKLTPPTSAAQRPSKSKSKFSHTREAPPLPTTETQKRYDPSAMVTAGNHQESENKREMEDFLDDLLT